MLPGHNNCNPLTKESIRQKEMERKRLRLLEEEEQQGKVGAAPQGLPVLATPASVHPLPQGGGSETPPIRLGVAHFPEGDLMKRIGTGKILLPPPPPFLIRWVSSVILTLCSSPGGSWLAT